MLLRPDIQFFHAPSVYDFRKHKAVLGPIADVIPSTSVFDMYPIGMTSMADYLEERGYRAQIINLAARMLTSKSYDAEKVIARSKARFFALDLHWLPHAHGAIEVAKIIKKYHPNKPVIIGGLTSSYFHRQLIEYPCIDYVLRGDSVEEPLYLLLNALSGKAPLADVPNLTYKGSGGAVIENSLSHILQSLDYLSIPSYRYAITSVFKYGSFKNILPFADWLQYPMTMLLTSRGCSYNCAICGGGRSAYERVCRRRKPAFRSPARLIEDVRVISSFSSAPIFVVHDLRHGGKEYAREFLERLSREKIDNEFVFELFKPAGDEYLALIDSSVARYSLQVSIESHVERIRQKGGKFSRYSNKDIFNTFLAAFKNGCRKIDLFFIVGLPEQDYDDAVGCVEYTRELLEQLQEKLGVPAPLIPYTAPYAPFLDPGCAIYEEPQKFGFTRLWDSLDDCRTALLAPSWKYTINYETKWLNRDQIVAATYAAAGGLNELKYEMNLIDRNSYELARSNLQKSLKVMALVDEVTLQELGQKPKTPIPPDTAALILQKVNRIQQIGGTEFVLCGKKEMRWPIKRRFKGILSMLKLGVSLIGSTAVNRSTSVARRRKTGTVGSKIAGANPNSG